MLSTSDKYTSIIRLFKKQWSIKNAVNEWITQFQ
jgi:hypothetical protein